MTEVLQHDPRTKQQIKDILYDLLYKPVQQQFKVRLNTIIKRNAVICRYSHASFLYKGILYNCDVAAVPRKMNRLDPSLQADMDEYLRDTKAINEAEVPYVLGFINQVLNSSNDLHDYLRLLPEAVHFPIQELVNTCPCRTKKLTDEKVTLFKEQNEGTRNMMRKRMVSNLLI